MIISVRAVPNAKKAEVVKTDEIYRVKIDARAEDGRANKRLIEILADYFDVGRSSVSIVKGFNSRNKVVDIKKN